MNSAAIESQLRQLTAEIDKDVPRVAMILAAGHGNRIRSEKSKMLHKIWGVPTVIRVADASRNGLGTDNQVIVLGIKALGVAEVLGARSHRSFTFQQRQRGTGDAVKVGMSVLTEQEFKGDVFVFPGDLGLLDTNVVGAFQRDFSDSDCDMLVLTAEYSGDPAENYYGRILRVPEFDCNGQPSGDDRGKVIEIREHKDILAMTSDQRYEASVNGRCYTFSRDDLMALNEFNTGIYAFRSEPLRRLIDEIAPDNVQGEFYVTDLISIFNRNGCVVKTSPARNAAAVLGFNNKTVLKEMEQIARVQAYDRLKNIITIQDPDDFFMAETVIDQVIAMDRAHGPLDIKIGKGVYISDGVTLSRGVVARNRAVLRGNITLGAHVTLHENVIVSTYPGQKLEIGDNTEVLHGNIIKGNLRIGTGCRVESGVRATGSDAHPTRIGNGVLIKGTTYIYGSVIEDGIEIEHSVLKCKKIVRTVRCDGAIQPVRWVLPLPEGLDSIMPLDANIA